MLSSNAELIWQGRIHIGDEPGIFGDASYTGLATEFPVKIERFGPANPESTKLIVETMDVQTFSGYPGHLIIVVLYEEDPAQQFHWNERVLNTERLTSADNNQKVITVDFTGATPPHYISVRIRVDTEVTPGLYDDFIVSRLSNKSANFQYVASFGF